MGKVRKLEKLAKGIGIATQTFCLHSPVDAYYERKRSYPNAISVESAGSIVSDCSVRIMIRCSKHLDALTRAICDYEDLQRIRDLREDSNRRNNLGTRAAFRCRKEDQAKSFG